MGTEDARTHDFLLGVELLSVRSPHLTIDHAPSLRCPLTGLDGDSQEIYFCE